MAKPPPDTSVVLQILLDRVLQTPAEDTAKKLGYKPKSISDIAGKYELEEFERQIRIAIVGQVGELTPEAQQLNELYDTRLNEISERIYKQAKEAPEPTPLTVVDSMKMLEVAAKSLEFTRQARLKIAGVITDNKRRREEKGKLKDEGYKSAYSKLIEDDEEDDD